WWIVLPQRSMSPVPVESLGIAVCPIPAIGSSSGEVIDSCPEEKPKNMLATPTRIPKTPKAASVPHPNTVRAAFHPWSPFLGLAGFFFLGFSSVLATVNPALPTAPSLLLPRARASIVRWPHARGPRPLV